MFAGDGEGLGDEPRVNRRDQDAEVPGAGGLSPTFAPSRVFVSAGGRPGGGGPPGWRCGRP